MPDRALAASRWLPFLLLLAVVALGVGRAWGQEVVEREGDLLDRPISAIRFEGVAEEDLPLVRNNIRVGIGTPYDPEILRTDVTRLHDLGRFKFITAEAILENDGSVSIQFSLRVQPRISEVQTTGNKAVSDQELRALVQLFPGGPRDDYLIEKAKRDIVQVYRKKGYFLTNVSVDEAMLEEQGLLLLRVIEGPRVRVRGIEFRGAESFSEDELWAEIKSRTYVFIFRAGVLDEDVITEDVARIDRFYKDRGYLDVRVDRVLELSPDNREAKIVFQIEEGSPYELRGVRVVNRTTPDDPLKVFSPEQVQALIGVKPGDVYRLDRVRESVARLQAAYSTLGYYGTRIDPVEIRIGPEPVVDLVLEISEGQFARIGLIHIQGNRITRDKVIRRLLTFEQGRPLDEQAFVESRRRLERTRLFPEVRITPQDPDPVDPWYRDVLLEVREQDTGAMTFGAAVGSDSGVFGEIALRQDNFDLYDLPETWRELFTGQAFRGAGQRFNATLRPGNELFEYSMSITEPHLFDTDYSLTVGGFIRERQFRQFDESRIRGNVGVVRSFGDVWQAGVRFRGDHVELDDIDPEAPTEYFDDQGPDSLNAVGLSLTRTTIGTVNRPGSGSRFEIGVDRFGVLGGDAEFFSADADYTIYFTLDEDFLGRKQTLRLNSSVGYIFGADTRVPTYERFYLGGRSFRGFDFRTIAPKGIRADNGDRSRDAVGGEWKFFLGAQYEVPLFDDSVAGVIFVDSGTVTEDVGFEDYRVSVGFGLRLYIQQLGPVPIALDFGFPLRDAEGDERQLFSFSAELPF